MTWIAAGAAVIGGGLSYMGSKEQADAAKDAAENQGAPWSGIQPYLTGGTTPAWMQQSSYIPSQDFMSWANGLATGQEGSWMQPAPQMYQQGVNPWSGGLPQGMQVGPAPVQQQEQPMQHYMGTDMYGNPSWMNNEDYVNYINTNYNRGTEGGGI